MANENLAVNSTGSSTFGLGTSEFTQTYSSFSGCDILAHFGNVQLGNLQGISFSITREKAPLFVMGSSNPVSFSRGKRGIAGSLIFTVFDRASLWDIMKISTYASKESFASSDGRDRALRHGGRALSLSSSPEVGSKLANPVYIDQIPPFDITLTGANEYGNLMFMAIFGVELLNEGSGISIDDISNESQITFVARDLKPWEPLVDADAWSDLASGGVGSSISDASTIAGTESNFVDSTQIKDVLGTEPLTES